LAEVAFGNDFARNVRSQCAIWTEHYAGPTTYAFVFVMGDQTGSFILGHGARKTGSYAGRVFTVSALDGKGNRL
jgi:hypothetical protein